jgi:hypothetical protein
MESPCNYGIQIDSASDGSQFFEDQLADPGLGGRKAQRVVERAVNVQQPYDPPSPAPTRSKSRMADKATQKMLRSIQRFCQVASVSRVLTSPLHL